MVYRRALNLKLLAVGHDIDESGADSIKALLDRGFHLKEHEEIILDIILNRGEQDEEHNPFDPHIPGMEVSMPGESTVALSMEELDDRLMDFALDHDWDDCDSMTDMGTLKSSTVHKRIPGLAQLSKRLHMSSNSAHTAHGESMQGRSRRLSAISEEGSTQRGTGTRTCMGSRSTVNGTDAQAGDTAGNAKKQQVDYLRLMREERDLQQLCALMYHTVPALNI